MALRAALLWVLSAWIWRFCLVTAVTSLIVILLFLTASHGLMTKGKQTLTPFPRQPPSATQVFFAWLVILVIPDLTHEHWTLNSLQYIVSAEVTVVPSPGLLGQEGTVTNACSLVCLLKLLCR